MAALETTTTWLALPLNTFKLRFPLSISASGLSAGLELFKNFWKYTEKAKITNTGTNRSTILSIYMSKAKRSESEEIHIKSKLPCIHCGKANKSNSLCKTCKETICIVHSTLLISTSEERICDECLEEYLIEELPDKEEAVELIRHDIDAVVTEREVKTQEICKISASCMHQKNLILEKTKEYTEKEREITKEHQDLKEKIRGIEEKTVKKNKEIEKNKNSLEFVKSKLEDVTGQLEKYSEEYKINTKERNIVLSELNELRDFIKMQVPVRLVKRVVCSYCYPKVQAEYYKVFSPESANSQIRPVSIHVQPKKGACTSCELF